MRRTIPHRAPRFVAALLALMALVFAASSTQAADDVRVSLAVSPKSVAIGDEITAEVSVEGAGFRAPSPNLPNNPAFEVTGTSSGQSISIVNGRTSASRTMTIHMTAVKPGTATIGPATVTIGGKEYRSETVEVRVTGAALVPARPPDAPTEPRDDAVFIDVRVSDTDVYPGQEVLVSYDLYVRDRLTSADAVAEPTFPGAIPHRIAGGGRLNFMSTTVGGKEYLVSPLARYAVYPVAPGEVTIDPFRLNVVVEEPRSSRRRGRDPFFEGFLFGRSVRKAVASDTVVLTVKPLPASGRPKDFPGNVGDFTLKTHADRTSVRVGEPVTLTVNVEGHGNTEALAPPAIAAPESVRQFSQTSRDESVPSFDTMKSARAFETIFVPSEAGDFALGPVELPVFNPRTKRYETLRAAPIDINVAPGARADMERPATPLEIDAAADGLRTIKPDTRRLAEASPAPWRRPWFWLLVAASPALFAARVRNTARREHLAQNVALARRMRASKEAERRLSAARSAIDGPAGAFGKELYDAVMRFVADHRNVEAASLTASAAREALARLGAADEDESELGELLRVFDLIRFGGVDPAHNERRDLWERTAAFIDRVNKRLPGGQR
ncbi:BatD family protein [bacterium]|nr:BatD family protein [bacterium]